MIPYRDSRLIRFVLIIFFLIVIGYAYFEGRALLYGPTIDVSPRVMETSEQFITIQGTALRIVSLSLNGTPIPVTEDGGFEEGYVLTPGYNRLVLDARDKYGKTAERVVEILYTPVEATPVETPTVEESEGNTE